MVLIIFILSASLLGFLSLIVNRLLSTKEYNVQKYSTYESGEDAIGNGLISFNINFYCILILAFIVFEIEIILLLPWILATFSLQSVQLGTSGIMIFILILSIGLLYLIRMKLFEWKFHNLTKIPEVNIPNSAYKRYLKL